VIAEFADCFGGPARLLAGTAEGLDLIVLDAPHLYDRPGNPYVGPRRQGLADNWQRFAALSLCRLRDRRGARSTTIGRDILHAHDWQAALVPAYALFGDAGPKTMMTVHNIAFQGQFGADIFRDLGLPPRLRDRRRRVLRRRRLPQGRAATADAITTVSPTYAQEIRTPEYGMGLEGCCNRRAPTTCTGIVNGIDVPTSGTRRPTRMARSTIRRQTLKARGNKRAVEALRARPGRRPDLLRGQPADLAEGHGHAGAAHRRCWSRRRAQARRARLRRPALEGASRPPPPPSGPHRRRHRL
jgi:starch synthase